MENNNQALTKNPEFRFSYFPKLWSTKSTITNLQKLYEETVSPRWKPLTEAYRELQDNPSRQGEAKDLKYVASAVVVEGVFRPNASHAAGNLEVFSGLAMYDFDHTDARTEEIQAIVRQLPYVAYAHISISARGLKVVVYLHAYNFRDYNLAYALCRKALELATGHPCDLQCAHATQPCSCVWDPNAYYNPTPQPYPWQEEVAADPSLTQLATPRGVPAGTAPAAGNRASSIPPETDACGYIQHFALTFAHYNPWQKGNRHETMLRLGRQARRKGFSKEELDSLTNFMSVHIVGDGYTEKELQKDLSAGYQYVDSAYTPADEANLLTIPTTDTFERFSHVKEDIPEDEMLIKNEEIRASTPCISNEIYKHLPSFFTKALKPACTKRERDILLLGILANLSGCMPQVRILYAQRLYSPHLYALVVAPPAAGKGLLSLAGILPQAVDAHLQSENKKKKEAYEQQLLEWEESNKKPRFPKGKPAPALAPGNAPTAAMPEEPPYYCLCGAASTSRNQLIRRLKTNADLGLIINATELDMISGSINQDYGKHDDVFRAAFHHEQVATDYKTEQKIICVNAPRLSLCLSGTPNQLPAFIRSLENGLYSRFLYYTCEAHWKYRSAAPVQGETDYINLYKELSREVKQMYFFLEQSPTEVTFSPRQWEVHTSYFDCLLNEVTSEQADAPGSIVLRAGLIMARIASVLTALRKYEGCMQMKEYQCTDEDFTSALQIVQATVNHSLLLASSLPGENVRPKLMKSYFQLRPILDELPSIFTYKQIKEKTLTKKISERNLCRYLKALIKLQYIEKQDKRYLKLKKLTENHV